MKRLSSLLLKYPMTAFLMEVVLLLMTDLNFGSILWISLVVTVVTFVIGDLIILSATSNMISTSIDFLLSLITIYMFNFVWTTEEIPFISALITSAALAAGEWFYHILISDRLHGD